MLLKRRQLRATISSLFMAGPLREVSRTVSVKREQLRGNRPLCSRPSLSPSRRLRRKHHSQVDGGSQRIPGAIVHNHLCLTRLCDTTFQTRRGDRRWCRTRNGNPAPRLAIKSPSRVIASNSQCCVGAHSAAARWGKIDLRVFSAPGSIRLLMAQSVGLHVQIKVQPRLGAIESKQTGFRPPVGN